MKIGALPKPHTPLNTTLTATAHNKRCRACHHPVSVALRYLEEEHRQEHFLRCGCFPKAPQLEKEESPMELYKRTGVGDAVTIMQTERRKIKVTNQDLMLARIEAVERKEDQA